MLSRLLGHFLVPLALILPLSSTLTSSCVRDIAIWLADAHLKLGRSKTELVMFCPRLPYLSKWHQRLPSCTSREHPESFLISIFSSASCNTSARPADSVTKTHPEPTQSRPPSRPPPRSKDLEPVMPQQPPASFVACRRFLYN